VSEPRSLPDIFANALGQDSARPYVTYYDDSTGERIELSGATLDNWVAKTANLLRDELGQGSGARVWLGLPLHWQTVVWTLACWQLGAAVVISGTVPNVDVAVCGPDTLDQASAAPEAVALSLAPMGAAFREPLPPGVLDYATAVRGHGDRFSPDVRPTGSEPALITDRETVTGTDLVRRTLDLINSYDLKAGHRLQTSAEPASVDGVILATVLPLALGAGTVLVRNSNQATDVGRLTAERVTYVASTAEDGTTEIHIVDA
jgi:uncharacterized protein (TIGR03089 family)